MKVFTVKELKAIGEWAGDNFTDADEMVLTSGFEDKYILVSQNHEKHTVYKLSEIMKNY